MNDQKHLPHRVKISCIYLLLVISTVGNAMAQTSDGDVRFLKEIYVNTGGPEGRWMELNNWPWDETNRTFSSDPSTWASDKGVTVNMAGYVTELNLSGAGLVGVLPDDFNIPTGIVVLPKIKLMDFSYNPGLEGELKAEVLTYLNNLEYLNISKTSISNIASEIYLMDNLETLVLQYLKLEELPDPTYTSNQKLQVSLAYNKLDICNISQFKKGFPNATIEADNQIVSSSTNPVSIDLIRGKDLELSVEACGENTSYQWYYKNESSENILWIAIADQTDKALSLSSNNVSTADVFRCIIQNDEYGLTETSTQYKINLVEELAPDLTIELAEDKTADVLEKWQAQQILPRFTQIQQEIMNAHGLSNQLVFEVLTQPQHGLFEVQNFSSMKYTPVENFNGTDELTYKIYSRIDSDLYPEDSGKLTFTVTPASDKPILTLTKEDGSVIGEEALKITFGDSVVLKVAINDLADASAACDKFEIKGTSKLIGKKYKPETAELILFPLSNGVYSEELALYAREDCDENLNSDPVLLNVAIEFLENKAPVISDQAVKAIGFRVENVLLKVKDETPVENLNFSLSRHSSDANITFNSKGEFTYISSNTGRKSDTFVYKVKDGGTLVVDPQSGKSTVVDQKETEGIVIVSFEGLSKQTLSDLNYSYTYYQKVPNFVPSQPNNSNLLSNARFVLNRSARRYFAYQGSFLHTRARPSYYWTWSGWRPVQKDGTKSVLDDVIRNSIGTWIWYYKGTGKVACEQKVYLSKTKSLELPANSSLEGQLAEQTDLIAFSDTVSAMVGDTIELDFMVYNGTDSEVKLEVVKAPDFGKLLSLEFSGLLDEVIHLYKGMYVPTLKNVSDIISYQASNGDQTAIGTKTIQIVAQNQAPVLEPISDIQILEDETLVVPISLTDADNLLSELIYTAAVVPATDGFEIILNDSVFSISPPLNFVGSVMVEVEVSDPDNANVSALFQLEVLPANDAPQFLMDSDFYTLNWNETFTLTIIALDVDPEDDIDFTFGDLPAWLSAQLFGANTLILSGTPAESDAGMHAISLMANDGIASTTQVLTLKVNGSVADQSPVVILPIENIILSKNAVIQPIDLNTVFSDPDNDELAFSIAGNSNTEWLSASISNSSLTIEIIDDSFTGYAQMEILATAKGLSVSTSFEVLTADHAPMINEDLKDIVVWKNSEDILVDLSNAFIDSDGDELIYSIAQLENPDLLTLTIEGNKLRIHFEKDMGGESVLYIAAEAYGKSVLNGFTITVMDELPEMVQAIPNQSLYKNDPFISIDLSEYFTDPDNVDLDYELISNSAENIVTSNISGNILRIDPLGTKAGNVEIGVQAKSGIHLIKTTVLVEILDHDPELFVIPELQNIYKNSTPLTFDLSNLFKDDDDEMEGLSIDSVSNESLFTFELSTFELSIVPFPNATGSSDVIITGWFGMKSIGYVLSIVIEDRAPELTRILPLINAEENDAAINLDLSNYFADPDGDALNFSVSGNSNTTLLNPSLSNSALTVEFKGDQFGAATILVTASADSKSVSDTLFVNVSQAVGVERVLAGVSFELYPNPVSNKLTIRCNGTEHFLGVEVRVSDLSGRVLRTRSFVEWIPTVGYEMDLSGLTKGVYLIDIVTDNRSENFQIIKR